MALPYLLLTLFPRWLARLPRPGRWMEIFKQCLVEAGTIGLAGGILGLGLAELGLLAVRQRPAGYAQLAHLDGSMLALTIAQAILASLFAGLLPAWRAMRIVPAIQLKSQ